MDIELTAKVTAVTVYSQQARVSVEASTTMETGAHRLIVGDLPLTLDAGSIRAGGQGAAKVRVHGVEVQRRFYEETPATGVRDLEAQIDKLEDELRAIADEQSILDSQGRYLEGLRGASEQYARGLALGRTTVEKQAQISQFFQEQDQALHANSRGLDKQKRELDRTLDKVRRELDQVTSARPSERNQAFVEVEVLSAGEFQLELTYNVNRASWKPLYDMRLAESDDGPELQIVGIAEITQSSGQEWLDVDLRVSTARTELNRRLPELKPWYINVFHPPTPRLAAAPMKAATAPRAMQESAQGFEGEVVGADFVTAEVVPEEGGATVTFDIVNKGNIPSDGAPHKNVLFETRLPAKVDYVAVPKHTDAVYRLLKATNDGVIPLLAGSVQLFVGERYIGTSETDYIPAGDEVELMIGAEERLTIERELVRREVDKLRLRDKRQIQYGYEIKVENLMSGPVAVEVHDQIPVSRHEEIKVKLLSSTPEPAERDDLNLMEWHLALEAGAETKVTYYYQVEHPRSLNVIGLID